MSDEEFNWEAKGRPGTADLPDWLIEEAERARASEKRLVDALNEASALMMPDDVGPSTALHTRREALKVLRAALSEVEG